MTDPAAPTTPGWPDLYDPARHTEDGHGGCVICLFGVPHTDDTVERVRWPCAVVREARSTPAEALDVERLAEALQQSSYGTAYHDTTGRRPTFADLTWEQRARKRQDASNIAAEYARLRSPENDR